MAQVTSNSSTVVNFKNDGQYLSGVSDGVISQLSWNNAFVMSALRQMFGCNDNELITAVEVTDQGIKAKFETR